MASLVTLALLAGNAFAQTQTLWGQCGGQGWSGATNCASGSCCSTRNPWYAQCTPGAGCGGGVGSTMTTTSVAAKATTSSVSTPAQTSTTSTASASASTSRVRFAGVNLAGFDFGCGTDGTCDTSGIYPPVRNFPPDYNHPDGAGQMRHFYNDDNMNIFRLPVGWQYLVNNNLGGTLDATNFGYYDQLVQDCLSTGAYCIVDIHNYARWNGAIIGQGGPTNDQFVSVWKQLAQKYASEPRIWFSIMNEPHDIPNISTWAATVQAVVTAIRKAGATSQFISLPGTTGSRPPLSSATGPRRLCRRSRTPTEPPPTSSLMCTATSTPTTAVRTRNA